MKIVLPMPPNLNNPNSGKSRHWRVRHKEKVAYWDSLDTLQMVGAIPKPPRPRFERAEITVTLYLWNLMDDDGAMARMKWAIDWMVKRGGFLRDDSRKHLRFTGIPEQKIDRSYQRVEIEIKAA